MAVENNSDARRFWDNCLNYMSMRVKSHSFNTWFKHTSGQLDQKDGVTITVPNQFVADWLADRYSELITEATHEIAGKPVTHVFKVKSNGRDRNQTEIQFRARPAEIHRPRHPEYPLNDRYRFDNFVVGNSNQFAHAATMAVGEAPGKTNYNPLLLYGGTGLGKTHLIQAIGHYVRENYPKKYIIYATSEKFTSDFIHSVSTGTIANFTSRYRSAEVLLIDDIQFFSGKESTQEQFFHTFNDLFLSGRQIVLTSDRHPRDIKGLEERLLSRFSCGLVADLQPPDLETRIAILRKRTKHEKTDIPEKVLFFIADNVTNNIRELEGSLTRLLAYASLEKRQVDLEFANRILGREISRPKKRLTIVQIQKRTAEYFQIQPEMMTARKKTSQIALARQIAMYLSRKYTSFSLKSIGEAFGGRDHTTVMHACDQVEKKISSNYDFKEKVNSLVAALLN